jgi:hypothetical protein
VADAGALFDTAAELLEVAAGALDSVPEQLGTDLDGAPDRQLIAYGVPVHDCCEQLVVWVNPVGEGARSPSVLSPVFQIIRPTLRIHATRCVPTGHISKGTKQYVPPDADAVTEASRQILADGWALWNRVFNAINTDPPLLFSKCSDLVSWGMQSITPGGGCGGWEMQFTVALDGYPEDLAT